MTKDEALRQAIEAMRETLDVFNATVERHAYDDELRSMAHLRAAIRAAESAIDESESRAATHSADCWSFGPGHYECAAREIERLRAELAESEQEPVAWRTYWNEREALAKSIRAREDE